MPELHPRTKPKALNYALPLARGEYLVIYDAEDRPDRDQLRLAFQAFSTGEPNLATVQAKLNLYNASDNWLTRQFTIEYCALFDGLKLLRWEAGEILQFHTAQQVTVEGRLCALPTRS